MHTKKSLLALGLFMGFYASSQQPAGQPAQNKHQVTKIWETDTIIKVPESVLPDVKNQQLYVSLIDGEGWTADGKGGIGILGLDGSIKTQDLVTGLEAPKGLGRLKGQLFVADITNVVVVDIKTGAVQNKIAVPEAQNLNDIAVNKKMKAVYVSDSKAGKIWRIINEKPEIFLDDVKGANGLKCIGDQLIFAKGKALWSIDKAGKQVKIATVPNGIDGIEPVGNGDFLVTSWIGYLYYVTASGQVETLLDTHGEHKNVADIGFDQKKQIIYIPSFMGKTVAAYQLK